MLAGGTLVLLVMLQAQETVSHWDAWVCGVCRLEREAWGLQQNGLLRRMRVSSEGPQPEQ